MEHLCENCKGSGRVVCPRCGGDREIQGVSCYYCKGDRFVECPACNGTGRVSDKK